MGDFNAHHPAWFSVSRDDRALARGVNIAEAIDSNPLCLLNEDSPTRLPPNGTPLSPDLTLISGHLALTASWLPSISLKSDHLHRTPSNPSPYSTTTTVEQTGPHTLTSPSQPFPPCHPPPPVQSAKRLSGISSGMPACASSQEAQSPITPPTSPMQPNASLPSVIA